MVYFLTILLVILCNPTFSTNSDFPAQYIKKKETKTLFSTQGKISYPGQGSYFIGFSVITEKNLWAIGNPKGKTSIDFGGMAFQSTDAGFSWKQKLFLDNEFFFDIHFVNAQCGWIVGYRGLILKTTDGGESWKRIQNLTQVNLTKIQFLNPNKGWVLGSGELWRTDDGGDHWLAFRSDRFSRMGNAFISLSFPEELKGWMIGNIRETGELTGEILSTTDGGISWQSRGSELNEAIKKSRYFDRKLDKVNEFEALKFVNPKQGYILTTISRKRGNGSSTSLVVVKTEDGGRNWIVIAKFNNFWFLEAQFINEKEIWINELSNHRLLHTIDGGKTWDEKVYPRAIDLADGPLLLFVNPNNCWLFSTSQNFLSQNLYTSDGGKTWERIKLKYESK